MQGSKKSISFFIIAVCMVVSCIYPSIGYAKDIPLQLRKDWGADESLLTIPKQTIVGDIKKIVITSFVTSDPTIQYSTKEYIAGLYYYLAITYAQDLPFSYIVGWDGSIYQGNTDIGASDTITIAYLANGSAITPAATAAFVQLMGMLNAQTGIGIHAIASSFFTFTNGNFMPSEDASWDGEVTTLKAALHGIIPDDSSVPQYAITIQSIDIKTAKDTNTALTIHFTNNAEPYVFGHVYAGSDNPSPLAVSDLWVSTIRSNLTDIGILPMHQHGTITCEINTAKPGIYPLSLYTDVAKIGGQGIIVNVNSNKQVSASVGQVLAVTSTMTFFDSAGGKEIHIASIQKGKQYVIINTQNLGDVTWNEILYDGIHPAWTTGS